jgi:chromosome segregation ATPase
LKRCQEYRAAKQDGDVDMLGDDGVTDKRVKMLQDEVAVARQSTLEKDWEIRRRDKALADKNQEVKNKEATIGHWSAGQNLAIQQLQHANRQIEKLKKKIDDLSYSDGALNEAKKTIAGQQAAIEEFKTKLSSPGTVVAGLTARRNALEAQVRTLQTDLAEATETANEAAQLGSDNEALKSQLNEAR